MAASHARQVRIQARYALVVNLRTPQSLFFGIAFPIILLLLFNSIFAGAHDSNLRFAGLSIAPHAYNTAGMAAYAVMVQTFTSLVITMTSLRESGQLKRLRGTPVVAWTFVAAYILRCIVLVGAVVTTLMVLGVVAFDVHLRAAAIGGIVIYAVLGTAALSALGIAVTAVTPTADVASAVGPFAAVLLAFVSGVFIPVTQLPQGLLDVGDVFPLAHLATGLQRCLADNVSGLGLDATDLLVLAGWMLLGAAIAARSFKWEPQTSRG